ncbi:MAG TPA: aminodeoxychorismate/anthranilate synthase component II [Candidatus Saccharimonadales bacterium]|nr:aminodeoxychorismate/anthranilate synthase component II [Candidatus Saccharimonadales bacterium]
MIVVVDHQDSFVYNLVQVVASRGRDVEVVGSESTSASELAGRRPDAVILSPGPGRPEHAGCFVALVRALPDDIPLLGVCLGHQALATAFGAKVVRAPVPVHGKTTPIYHDGKGIFAGLASPLEGGRYHSLVVERSSLPEDLAVTAETEDGLVMGMEHRQLPRFGVQFHPESILTPEGPAIISRFLALVGDGS